MNDPIWYRPRHYKHFDRPVAEDFLLRVTKPDFVARHSFSPLIHYMQGVKRYKPQEHKTLKKPRPIMYASHRDACILSYYAHHVNILLDDFYAQQGLQEAIVAYRTLGKANYHFSAEAYKYALQHAPCMILAFDVSGFFDNLDHKLLKYRLKNVLGVTSLSEDWLRVFRSVTAYHYVNREDLRVHPLFKEAMARPGTLPIATVAELKEAGVVFHPNMKQGAGIPQGTPISATFSNLYMTDFDCKVRDICNSMGAFYRRYSDDILIICPSEISVKMEEKISQYIAAERLVLSEAKTERTLFNGHAVVGNSERSAQYLGFCYYPGGAGLRPSSLSNQWRKMKRGIKKAKKAAQASATMGKSGKVYTKKLRRRFSSLQFRNFSSYARRSDQAFGGNTNIVRQIRRIEKAFERELAAMDI